MFYLNIPIFSLTKLVRIFCSILPAMRYTSEATPLYPTASIVPMEPSVVLRVGFRCSTPATVSKFRTVTVRVRYR